MSMLNQLVGLMGALPVHKEDSPLMTFKGYRAVTGHVHMLIIPATHLFGMGKSADLSHSTVLHHNQVGQAMQSATKPP